MPAGGFDPTVASGDSVVVGAGVVAALDGGRPMLVATGDGIVLFGAASEHAPTNTTTAKNRVIFLIG